MSNRLPTLRQAGGIAVSAIQPRFAPVRNEGNLMNPGSDFLAAIGFNSTALGGKVNELTALGVSSVFACVDYISKIIATLPLDLIKNDGTGRKPAAGHPARIVLRFIPNPEMTSSDVRGALAYQQALTGNAYAQLVYNRAGRIAEIWPLETRNVTLSRKNGFPEYTVTGDQGAKTFGFRDILHLKGMTPNGLNGRGPLNCVANLIGLAQALEENASRFFANGSRPGMVYTTAPGVVLTTEQRTALREQLEAAYRGVENFFKTMVLEGGGKMEMTRANNDSSQFDEIARRTHQQICQVFGVPPHKVGILDNATFSNIEEQQIQAMQDLIGPWCKRWEEAFAGSLLLPAERETHYFKHNLNGLLRGDIVKRTTAQVAWIQNSVLNPNEVRELEDLDPVEGGDTYVRQLNMIDINAPAAPPAPTLEPAAA